MTRYCEPARLLSPALQRRCPESSFCERPAPTQLLASTLAAGPGLVQHHQTADSASEGMGMESAPAPCAHPPPGCCVAVAASASPGPEIVAVPLLGPLLSELPPRRRVLGAASLARLAGSGSCGAPDLGRATLQRWVGASTRWLGNPLPAPPPPARPPRRAAPRAQEL